MKINYKDLPRSQVELAVEINQEELKPQLEKAAVTLSATGVSGFRPGHAPYDVVAKHFGEMRIYEAAAEAAISQAIHQANQEKKMEMVGEPKVEIEKMAPGDPLVFKIIVSLLPKVKLADWPAMKFKRQPKPVGEAEVAKVLEEVRKTRASEVLVDRPAQASDKVVIDMAISQNNVPMEGGQAKDHAVFLDEKYYIPGLPEQLLGLKKDESKEFSLTFPETHYQKHLAGKKSDFKVTVKAVYERTLPALDDIFAQGLGQKTLADLRQLIEDNLKTEAGQKEEQRLEIEIMESLVKKSDISELPEVLMVAEKQKMFEELKQSLSQMNIPFEEYLKNIKKTEEEIGRDFEKGAAERVKSALVIREVAQQEKISCTPEELKQETERVKEVYKENSKIEERLADPGVQEHLANLLINRKTIMMLKEKVAS